MKRLLPWFACSLFVLPPSTLSQEQEDREVEGEVAVGLGYVSDDEFRYGRYTGLVEEGVVPWLDFQLISESDWDSSDANYWRVEGEDLGRETVFLDGERGRYGDYALRLQYREIPHYFFDDGQTPFRLAGDNRWILPNGWQVTGASTQSMVNLSAFLAPVEIEHQRRRLDLDYQQQLPKDWDFQASYRHQIKEGQRTLGAVIGSNGGNARGVVLPSEVDFETDIIELALAYSGRKSTLGFRYYGSFFQNKVDQLTWQNPFGPQVQWAAGVAYPGGQGRLGLEPDNSAHRFSLAGSHVFSRNTRGSFELGYGRMLQDDDFLPYTINDALTVTAPLARNSLDGEIETFTADLRLTTRPLKEIYLVTRYRLDDRDNQTPRLLYQPVPGDSTDQITLLEGVLNRPYSYRQQTLSIDARYRTTRTVRVDVGYEVTEIDRDYSEINESTEYVAKLGARLNTFERLGFSFTYKYSERDGERYVGNRPLIRAHPPGTVAQEDFQNHPLLRKYYLADRQRDRLQLRADWFVSDQLSFGFNAAYNRDDYTDEYFGLNEVDLVSYTVDGSYVPAEHWHMSAYFSTDRYEQDQSGRAFTFLPAQVVDPDRNWWVNSANDFDTVSVSAEYSAAQQRLPFLRDWGLSGDLDLGFEFSSSRSTGDVETETGPALNGAPLPDLETDLRYYRLYGRYDLTDRDTVSLSLSHESYDSDDFALDGVDPGTVERVLTLGEESQDYSVNWIAIGYRHRFR